MTGRGETGARERIIRCTIDLIREKQDVTAITVRDIAQAAGVGIGLVNYHFGSKDRLVKECVQLIIGEVISSFPGLYQSLDMSPVEKLRFLVKSTASFLASNPGISRVSILSDLTEPSAGDNSVQSMEAYLPVFREALAPDKSETEAKIITQAFLGAVQAAFLHAEGHKSFSGIDFFDKTQRDCYIDTLIDVLVRRTDRQQE